MPNWWSISSSKYSEHWTYHIAGIHYQSFNFAKFWISNALAIIRVSTHFGSIIYYISCCGLWTQWSKSCKHFFWGKIVRYTNISSCNKFPLYGTIQGYVSTIWWKFSCYPSLLPNCSRICKDIYQNVFITIHINFAFMITSTVILTLYGFSHYLMVN